MAHCSFFIGSPGRTHRAHIQLSRVERIFKLPWENTACLPGGRPGTRVRELSWAPHGSRHPQPHPCSLSFKRRGRRSNTVPGSSKKVWNW